METETVETPECVRCGARKVEDGGTEDFLLRRREDSAFGPVGEILCLVCLGVEYKKRRAAASVRRTERWDAFKKWLRGKVLG